MGMSVNPLMMAQPAAEEVDDEDEDMGVAETFADYMPTKCKFVSFIICKEFVYIYGTVGAKIN